MKESGGRKAEIIRIGIFYDGSFFAHVSDHYRYHHRRKARISFAGMHKFIRHEIAKRETSGNTHLCNIVEAHYFRSRFPAEDAKKHDALLRDRKFEDVLIRAGITPHFLLMPSLQGDVTDSSPVREKGIDVWLALEAYDLAVRGQLSVAVLVAGDADFVQLVRKLNATGTRTMLTGWDLMSSVDGSRTRTAQVLLDEATYPVMMNESIDSRQAKDEFDVDSLFMTPSSSDFQQEAEGAVGVRLEDANESRSTLLEGGRAAGVRRSAPEPSSFAMGFIDNLVFEKGFGFIRPDSGGENLFFHASDVEGCDFAELRLLDKVRFVVTPNPKDGRPAARRVLRLPIVVSRK